MNKEKITEEDLRNYFLEYSDNSEELFYSEIPVFSRSVDVVKYNKNTNDITAIELKLHDWKKVIKQVLTVNIAFDFLQICMLEPKSKKKQDSIIEECSKHGIGVYFFNYKEKKINKIISSRKIYDIWDIQKSEVIKYLIEYKNKGK